MTVEVRLNLARILLVALVYSSLPFSVNGDLRIVDKWENSIVFQTASDFVRTGCGSFQNKSSLVVSEPLDACGVPQGPPQGEKGLLSKLYQSLFDDDLSEEATQWVLIASGEGDCDLKTKFRNAASAGYSGIIVGTDQVHEEIIHPGLLSEDDEEFIDVHLVHPLDIQVLSKGYAYPNQYIVEPPCLTGCKEEYQRTFWRSRYVSLALRTWKRIMEMCWECIKAILLVAGGLTKGLKFLVPSVFHTRDTFYSIAIYLASIVMSITVMMLISIHNTYRKIMKYKDSQQEKQRTASFSETDFGRDDKRRADSQSGFGNQTSSQQRSYNSSSSNYNYYANSSSRSSSRSSSPAPTNRVPIDYTRFHRINLDMKLSETLTKARVNNAYRELALKYHPDKNLHLDEEQRAKLTEEFRSIKKSRDVLLCYCVE